MISRCGGCGDRIDVRTAVRVGHGLGRLCALCAPVADEVAEIHLFELELAIEAVNQAIELAKELFPVPEAGGGPSR